VFLQLVTVADNGEFARRRVDREALEAGDRQSVAEILEQFGSQRLLTFDQDPLTGRATVELAHESLLEVWPRLSTWVDQAREELVMRSSLNVAMAEWEANERDDSFLLSGGRLAQHEAWTGQTDLILTEAELDYLTESRGQEERERSRLRRRRLLTTAGFGLAALTVLVFVAVALQQNDRARATQRVTEAVNLASAAISQLELDPELSLLLALEAVDHTRRVDGSVLDIAEEALHRAVLADIELARLIHNGEGIADFSPDGETFVTASNSLWIAEIWRVDPLEMRVVLQGHESPLIDAVFNSAGDRVATTSLDNTVRVWDTTTGESEVVLDALGPAGSFAVIPAFSNDGSLLAVTTAGDAVLIWDLDSGAEPMVLEVPAGNDTLNLEFSSDDSLLAVSRFAREGDVGPLVFDVATGDLVEAWSGHSGGVSDIGFTPDGSRLVTAGIDGMVRIWDTETMDLLATFAGHRGPIVDLQISTDGTLVATAGDVDVLVWDLASREVRARIVGHDGQVDGIDISPDQTRLLTSSRADQTTRLWDLTTYSSHELIGLPGPLTVDGGVAFSGDGAVLAASRGTDRVTLWDPVSGNAVDTFEVDSAVYRMDFDTSDRSLAMFGVAGTSVLDISTGEVTSLSGPVPSDVFSDRGDVDFGPDGLLASASYEGVRLWEPPFGEEFRLIPMNDSFTVAVGEGGDLLATGGPIGVRIYRIDGRLLSDLYPPPPAPPSPWVYAVALHPERPLLASAGDDADVVLWSTATYEELFRFEGHTANVLDVEFHPTNGDLVTAGEDGTLRFWSVDTGLARMNIPAPGSVSDLAISPDGRYLAVTGARGFVTVYILEVEELMSEAESRLSRWWTETECMQYLDSDTCPEPPGHLSR
jgi:WD40 repeat protein